MSDSFADLWASSAPTKPTPQQPQKTIGSSAPPRRQQNDAFSILSASQPSSRYVPNNQPGDRQGRQPQPASRGGDAFSDLFTSSLDGTPANRNPDRANLTMAERTVLAQKAKVRKITLRLLGENLRHHPHHFGMDSTRWHDQRRPVRSRRHPHKETHYHGIPLISDSIVRLWPGLCRRQHLLLTTTGVSPSSLHNHPNHNLDLHPRNRYHGHISQACGISTTSVLQSHGCLHLDRRCRHARSQDPR